ncbi:uncharacterized protein BDV17DRAFT_242819 [Aspergillus undulatus]|uniref:uncharacterized protein n=1 Tax=Aspergillus undulatus TaxID=1810928 RepID=UPI003CCDB867
MHMPHSLPTPVIGDRSGEVDSIYHLPHIKAMLSLFVGPDSSRENMASQRNFLPPPYFSVPFDNLGHGLPAITFDYRTMNIPSPNTTIKYEQYQVGDHPEPDVQSSSMSHGFPIGQFFRLDAQTSSGQYNPWHASYGVGELADSDVSNTYSSRSTSQNSHHWQPPKIDNLSPASHFAVGDFSYSNASASAPDLVHPAPRHGPSPETSWFASGNVPETISAVGETESSFADPMSENNGYAAVEANWTSDDLAYSCLPPSQSPDTTTITTASENCTTIATDDTCHTHLSSPWPSLNTQMPCDGQTNVSQCENEASWKDAPVPLGTDQEQGKSNQFPMSTDDIDGLPCLESSTETFVQPSSLLDPYGLTRPSLFPNGNSITPPEHNSIQLPGDGFVLQDEFRPDDLTDSCFHIPRHVPFRSCHTGCTSPWTIDARNALLIEYKRRGLSYKDIKRIGGFKEAESTLRGRYRTLTKSKEQRVRRPQWHDNDIRLLREAVSIYSNAGRYTPCHSVCRSRRPNSQLRVPWKKVSQYIWSNGGSYQFGNSTCKKKWCEVRNRE